MERVRAAGTSTELNRTLSAAGTSTELNRTLSAAEAEAAPPPAQGKTSISSPKSVYSSHVV